MQGLCWAPQCTFLSQGPPLGVLFPVLAKVTLRSRSASRRDSPWAPLHAWALGCAFTRGAVLTALPLSQAHLYLAYWLIPMPT